MRLEKVETLEQLDILIKSVQKVSIDDKNVVETVTQIIDEIRTRGDSAVFEQIKRFDGALLKDLSVGGEEFAEAYELVSPDFIDALKIAMKRIEDFHILEMPKSWYTEEKGIKIGEVVKPLDSVGCYVPGGGAAYPTSVLMTVLPARVAGVGNIMVCTPCGSNGKVNPYTLVASSECGCRNVFKIGGASAIAAMAYGTQTVPRVDKVVGPGNIYVTAAKKKVYGTVGIDSLAGPSEVAVIAQKGANAKFAALDLMAQAEHGSGATAILITDDEKTGREIIKNISESQADKAAFLFILVDGLDFAFEAANRIAPEHIELLVDEPFEMIDKVTNAGAILVGEYTPAAFGDYIAGPNHVLPTGTAARFQSPLGTREFIKYQSVLYCDKEALAKLVPAIDIIAKAEGLTAHGRSATDRLV